MITREDYFGPWADHPDATDEVYDNAEALLEAVNPLLDEAFADGVDFHINPATKSYISGKTLGGFRPKDAAQGSPGSSHKDGRGLDVYDPKDELDDWCMRHPERLRAHGLYMEHPSATKHWCHLTNRPPSSGKTVFYP